MRLTVQAVASLEIRATDSPPYGVRSQIIGVVTAQFAGQARRTVAVSVAQKTLCAIALLLALSLARSGQQGIRTFHIRVCLLLIITAGASIQPHEKKEFFLEFRVKKNSTLKKPIYFIVRCKKKKKMLYFEEHNGAILFKKLCYCLLL